MKSPQVAKLSDADRYSDLRVLSSNAGHYVGSTYGDGEPGTRDSGYYPNREAAERALSQIISGKLEPRLESVNPSIFNL